MALVGSFFHVGIVVAELEPARAHLGELLGLSWGRIIEIPVHPVRDGAGNDSDVAMRVCFSLEEPHIELIQEQPGTTWTCNEHSNLHHIGLWSDALAADSASFDELRCPLALAARAGDTAPVHWAYHRDPLGFNVELLDHAGKLGMYQLHFGDRAC